MSTMVISNDLYKIRTVMADIWWFPRKFLMADSELVETHLPYLSKHESGPQAGVSFFRLVFLFFISSSLDRCKPE